MARHSKSKKKQSPLQVPRAHAALASSTGKNNHRGQGATIHGKVTMEQHRSTYQAPQAFVSGGILRHRGDHQSLYEDNESDEANEQASTLLGIIPPESKLPERMNLLSTSPSTSELPSDDEIIFVGKSRPLSTRSIEMERTTSMSDHSVPLTVQMMGLPTTLLGDNHPAPPTSTVLNQYDAAKETRSSISIHRKAQKLADPTASESSNEDAITKDYIENMLHDLGSESPSELLAYFASRDLDLMNVTDHPNSTQRRSRPKYRQNEWSQDSWAPSELLETGSRYERTGQPTVNTLIPGPGERIAFELTERGRRKKERLKGKEKVRTRVPVQTYTDDDQPRTDTSSSPKRVNSAAVASLIEANTEIEHTWQLPGGPDGHSVTDDDSTGHEAAEKMPDGTAAYDGELHDAGSDAETTSDTPSADPADRIDYSESMETPNIILGDAYDGFDVMDHSRPSLSVPRKRKAKKGGNFLALPAADDELQALMDNAWAADRSKKKARKMEREQLRKQGLLGGTKAEKQGGDDLKIKYARGMTLEDIAQELQSFCQSGAEQLSLPPLDASARKVIHTVCHKLGCKSKSFGKGNARFLTVLKTKHHYGFDVQALGPLSRNRRQYFARSDVKQLSRMTPRLAGGASFTSVRTLAGTKVGEGAPELGSAAGSAKAKAMMEKMGWSTGQGLGQEHNKGRLDPVEHIVRYSRAGLG